MTANLPLSYLHSSLQEAFRISCGSSQNELKYHLKYSCMIEDIYK